MRLAEIVKAILAGEALVARSLVQDWLSSRPDLTSESKPESSDGQVLALSAGLVELFAERLGQRPPDWTQSISPLAEPLYLLKAAARMPRLRQLCHEQSPAPLRRRNLYAPADYLTFV
jgi:hypothetical protein